MLELLRDLQINKNEYLRTETGKDFEDRIENQLRIKYSKIQKRDIATEDFQLLKSIVKKKEEAGFFNFSGYPNTFIKTPFGSQEYPDFLIFSGRNVIPLEIKYSKKHQVKPMWNSGLPRPNGVYIFGSHGSQDITFFLGGDVLNKERRRELIGFFEHVKTEEQRFKRSVTTKIPDTENRGFTVYIRRAYEQQKLSATTVINYFTHPDRQATEKHAIEIVASLV